MEGLPQEALKQVVPPPSAHMSMPVVSPALFLLSEAIASPDRTAESQPLSFRCFPPLMPVFTRLHPLLLSPIIKSLQLTTTL